VEECHINTVLNERDFALSPDGNEIFYTLQSPGRNFQTIIYRQKDKNGKWSEPAVAPFAGRYSDLEPAFTVDGMKLYFVSNRPINGGKVKDFDIWMVEKSGNNWGKPKNIGAPVNSPANEFYPSPAASGSLYFTADYSNGVGKEDIYYSAWDGSRYLAPVPLDTAINSVGFDFNAFVSPDEQFIIFSSQGRKDEIGRGDLYISEKACFLHILRH
jgi:Tol biopolymer transport system component